MQGILISADLNSRQAVIACDNKFYTAKLSENEASLKPGDQVEFSIKEDIPSYIEENGKKYHRFWGDYTIQIPDNFNALKSYNRPKYGKRSSGEGKRFY